ncbi:MAG: glycosyltransferase, partial [Candidatus Latescibacteria bacterium]|nr:glycosyltransferase [Candidatus Latescibacterota bacterium]
MAFTKLSILIPVYNERYYVEQLIDQVIASPLPSDMERELVIVDDCSTDGTREILDRIANERPDVVKLHAHAKNQGKGAAIRTAVERATGDLCVIQDADLEYDPRDYDRLLRPLLSGDADVVYGSRFLSSDYRQVHAYWHAFGNRVLTTASNLFTDLTLTDMETCYKVAKSSILKSIPLRSNRFGMEPELTAKFAKRGCRIYEVPISYRGRTYDEGKKIKWIDGFKAVWAILYFRLVDDIYKDEYGPAAHGLSRTHRTHAWIADVIKPWVGESVLEVGAGLGITTLKLLPRRSYTVGDDDSLNLDYLSSRFGNYTWLEVHKIDLAEPDDFAGLEACFDTVVCLSALEHVDRDRESLQSLSSTLSPGGAAIIMVPQG